MKNNSYIKFCIIIVSTLCFNSSVFCQKNLEKADKLFDLNMFSDAIPFYEAEVKINDRDTKNQTLLKLANCFRIIGEFEKAEAIYKELLKKNRKDPQAILNYAISLKNSAKYAEASDQFNAYLKLTPDDPLGEIYLQSCYLAQDWLSETIGKEVRNLEKLNSSSSDFAPTLLSESEMVFSSSRIGSTQSIISLSGGSEVEKLDLYNVNINSIDFKDKIEIKKLAGINTPLHEGPASYSKDGNEIYFTRLVKGKKNSKTNKLINTLQIFYSKKDSLQKWSKPISAFEFNSSEYSIGQPSLSPDGNTIYYMSDMPGGYGSTDIYCSAKQKDGTWSSPKNLGSQVNTFGHELFPYISENGILYFSTDARPGMGQLDIFSAELINKEWKNIVNLKPPINSIGNDFGITLDGKYMRGFFSSDRFNGKGAEDIYSFSEAIPLELTILNNKIKFKDKSIFDGVKYKLINEKDGSETSLEPNNGIYTIEITNSGNYTLSAKKNGFTYNKISMNVISDSLGNYLEAKIKPSLKPILVDGYLSTKEKIDSSNITDIPLTNLLVTLSDTVKIIEQTNTKNNGYYVFNKNLAANNAYVIKAIKSKVNKKVKCTGIVKNNGNPLIDAAIELYEDDEISEIIKSNKNGNYSLELFPNKKYTIKSYKSGYDTIIESFTTSEFDCTNGINKEINLKELPKRKTISFTGKITDSSSVLSNTQIIVRLNNKIVDQTKTSEIGEYNLDLLPNNHYTITANIKGYMQKEIDIYTKENTISPEVLKEVKLEPIKFNTVLIWDNILFESGKSIAIKESLPVLDKLVLFMKSNPDIAIELSAHTDSRGDAKANLDLSQARAEYVKGYLVMEDIEPKRVISIGFGESKPLIANEKTDSDFQKNRRTEIKILKNL